jgi:hypothetical protein
MDFKGYFTTGDGKRCDPFTIFAHFGVHGVESQCSKTLALLDRNSGTTEFLSAYLPAAANRAAPEASPLIVVQLKQGSFKSEYKGQMELYLRWLDAPQVTKLTMTRTLLSAASAIAHGAFPGMSRRVSNSHTID